MFDPQEPLLEEYSVAAQIYKLSPAGKESHPSVCARPLELTAELPPDMCELARNSCAQSGFEMEIKRHWLGPDWYKAGVHGNLIHKTNVPNLRAEYRQATLMEERDMVSVSFLSRVPFDQSGESFFATKRG